MGKLSYALIDLGFFSALGTSEHPALRPEEQHVTRGTANTFDSNNGVLVVYDEEGRPWIINSRHYREMMEALENYNLKRGAYVPHSNDGGYFIRNIVMVF